MTGTIKDTPAAAAARKEPFHTPTFRQEIPERSLLDDDDDDDEEVDNAMTSSYMNNNNAAMATTTPKASTGNFSTESLVHWGGGDTPSVTTTAAKKSKHRRHTMSAGTAAPTAGTAATGAAPKLYAWDDFVRQGTRIKTLLGESWQHVAAYTPGKRRRQQDQEDSTTEQEVNNNGPEKRRRLVHEPNHAAELAREKMQQVLELQGQLKEAQAHTSSLQASNESLREESSNAVGRLQKTIAALRIAGSNAAKARADADTADATSTGLAQSLQTLQTVVTETKRSSVQLHQEQQQVAAAASSLQVKLVQKEADLARALKDVQSMRVQQNEWLAANTEWKKERAILHETVDDQKQGLTRLNHTLQERNALERARKERADKIEMEHAEQTKILQQVTAGQVATVKTQAALEETIAGLRTANEQLHQQLQEQQELSRKEKERLHQALTKAETKAQQLRIQGEAAEEDMQRLGLDKTAAEKQVAQLKSRMAGLERRLKDSPANSMVSPDAVCDAPPNEPVGLRFSLPPLSGSSRLASVPTANGQENSNNVPVPPKCCSICFKGAFGLMKSCQCGKKDCDKRAHLTCVNRIQPGPSVSHPGTPAPRLPLVLCVAIGGGGVTSGTASTAGNARAAALAANH